MRLRRDLAGLDVLLALLVDAERGQVDDPAMGYVADGLGDLPARCDAAAGLPVDEPLPSFWIHVHDCDAELADNGPAQFVEPGVG